MRAGCGNRQARVALSLRWHESPRAANGLFAQAALPVFVAAPGERLPLRRHRQAVPPADRGLLDLHAL